jgi:anti-sigma B factor antagonist
MVAVSLLEVTVRAEGTARVVALVGELDISGVGLLQDRIGEAEADRPPLIVLDLRRLAFIDSSGLRMILEADMRARASARRLAIVQGPEPVERVFRVALLDKRLEIVSDPSEVLPGDGG